jgi:flagellar basal body rod protein FlgG
MGDGIYVAYTGVEAELAELESIANNIANASTSGFRRDRTTFDTVLAAAMPFASIQSGAMDLTPGTPQLTGNPVHGALQGENAFFAVEGEGGEVLYTRRGDFRLDAQGRLVLPNGRPVLGEGGALSIPQGSSAQLRGDAVVETQAGPIGRLRVVSFADPSLLEKAGNSLIRALPGADPQPIDTPRVSVGFVEGSNVNLAAEMASMIQTARSFEAAMRSLRTEDELTQSLLQAIR